MAKFVFKMENILEVKCKVEDQKKSAYATALAFLDEEQTKLKALETKQLYYEEQLEELMMAVLQLDKIRQLEDGIEVIKYHIQQQMIAVQNAEVQAERARVALQNAMIERKTYEKLKEKAFEEFKTELNAQEKKEVDELVSYTFGAAH